MEKKYKTINLQEDDEKNKNDFKKYNYPSPSKKDKKIAKPDFSPILFQETQFGFKTNGSYKKNKIELPQSPIKTKNKYFTTSSKIEGRDLFNSKIEKITCRKLNFNDDEEDEEIQNKENSTKKSNKCFNLNMFKNSFLNIQKSNLKQNKMEQEFKVIKTIKNTKLDYVYKVEEKVTQKIFCVKKIYKNSEKNNINNIEDLFNDMKNKKNYNNIINENSCIGHEFCNHYIDFWVEDENLDIIFNNGYIPQKYLYILYNYYPNGDLLDYLGKLEQINYKFTPEFYWDIIFEMIMGLKYFHELGYLHLDIKPTNFLVDQKGYIKLTDFGLCHKLSEIPFLTDITEGDSMYISKELFNFNSQGMLDAKTDIFSLGLSFFEIIAKIILPSYGDSWVKLRSGNFHITEKLLRNCNINENKEIFVELISQMIAPLERRADLNQLINNFPELNKRYELLKRNEYKKSIEIPEIKYNFYCKKEFTID